MPNQRTRIERLETSTNATGNALGIFEYGQDGACIRLTWAGRIFECRPGETSGDVIARARQVAPAKTALIIRE